MAVELVCGYLTGSMALVADGWHMSSHALAMFLAWMVYVIGRKPALRARMSFGTGKVSALGGWYTGAPDAAVPMGRPGSSWRVTVPAWRADVQRPVDLIEDVGRHHGFEHLPGSFPAVEEPPGPSDPRMARDARVRRAWRWRAPWGSCARSSTLRCRRFA